LRKSARLFFRISFLLFMPLPFREVLT